MTRQKSISISISRILISLLLAIPVTAQAQSRHKKVIEEPDTTAFLNGFAVSVDAVGPLMLYLGDYGSYEAALRINLKDKYFPIVELGYGESDATDDATHLSYKTKAPFGRIGLDFNILKNKHDDYRLYLGGRYGYTSYKYDLFCPPVKDPVWGDMAAWHAEGIEAYYHWLEFCAGIDVKIWGPIHLGWSARYKRRLFHDEGVFGKSWYVPGYGKTGGTRLGGTFNLSIDI